MDLYHRLLIYSINSSFPQINTADNLKSHTIPEVCELYGYESKILHPHNNKWYIKNKLLSLLPIKDFKDCIEDIFDPKKYFDSKILKFAEHLKKNNNFDSLQFLNKLIINGIGSHLIQKEISEDKDIYCIDLRYMSQFHVRSDCLPYGAKLCLDQDLNPTKIILGYHIMEDQIIYDYPFSTIGEPSHDNWLTCCSVFVSSLIAHVILIDSFLYCHLRIAGNIASIFAQHNQLFPTSNLTSYFLPFFYKIEEVNSLLIETFYNYRGLFTRLFGFTSSGLDDFIAYGQTHKLYYIFNPMNQCIHSKLKSGFDQTISIYNTIKQFVSQMLETLIKSIPFDRFQHIVNRVKKLIPELYLSYEDSLENLTRIITTHIFISSYWNNYLNGVSEILLIPHLNKTKVFNNGGYFETEQNMIQNYYYVLAKLTFVSVPRLMSNIWLFQPSDIHKIYQEFQKKLLQLGPISEWLPVSICL
jgi:hypothetical protein